MKTKFVSALVFVCKLALGLTFIYASYSKIQDPAAFAKILYGYGLFPAVSINLIAIVLPFIELVAGFSIIMRLYPRSALAIINLLLFMFILTMGINLIRGHEFDCGCFSVAGQDGHIPVISTLVRDSLLLAAGWFVWKKTAPEK